MNQYPLRLPQSLMEAVKIFSKEEGSSMNQFFVTAIAEKISAIKTYDYLAARAELADIEAYKKSLDKVKDQKPLLADDEI